MEEPGASPGRPLKDAERESLRLDAGRRPLLEACNDRFEVPTDGVDDGLFKASVRSSISSRSRHPAAVRVFSARSPSACKRSVVAALTSGLHPRVAV